MHSDHMSMGVQGFLSDANDLQWKKNKDYHPEGVAFLEIFRTCAETGITVEQDLWAKYRKQHIALRAYFINGAVESEPPRSRMMDVAVYMGMMSFWDANKKSLLRDALMYLMQNGGCENPDTHCEDGHKTICDNCQLLFWLRKHAR